MEIRQSLSHLFFSLRSFSFLSPVETSSEGNSKLLEIIKWTKQGKTVAAHAWKKPIWSSASLEALDNYGRQQHVRLAPILFLGGWANQCKCNSRRGCSNPKHTNIKCMMSHALPYKSSSGPISLRAFGFMSLLLNVLSLLGPSFFLNAAHLRKHFSLD